MKIAHKVGIAAATVLFLTTSLLYWTHPGRRWVCYENG